MKKILAILLAFCLVFSVVGTATFVLAEDTETTQTPIYTASATTTKAVYDNTIITSGVSVSRSGSGYQNIWSTGSGASAFETIKG